jgi:hypothetical protein
MSIPDNKQSILSVIPSDASNIIKDFLVEERQVIPLKINSCCNNFFFTKYKEGYKIDKVLSLVKFERSYIRRTDENKERDINRIQKDIKKHYPIFIDEEDDVIQHMYNMFYDEHNPDDEDYDQEDSMCVTISMAGCKTHCYEHEFKRKLKLYIKMIGKVYKKK